MAKFNVVQKQRRAHKAQTKRDAHGDPLTKKLKIKQQPTYVSSKRKRKLMKKKRRVWILCACVCFVLCISIESICDADWLFSFCSILANCRKRRKLYRWGWRTWKMLKWLLLKVILSYAIAIFVFELFLQLSTSCGFSI